MAQTNETTEQYDDEVKDCSSKEELYGYIDDRIPNNIQNIISAKRVRQAIKSVFQALFHSPKIYKYNFNVFYAQYIGQGFNDKYWLVLHTYDSGYYFTAAAIDSLRKSINYKIFPQINMTSSSRGYSEGRNKSYSNVKLNLNTLHYDSNTYYIEITEGYENIDLNDQLVILTSESEIPIYEKRKNVDGTTLTYEKLVIPNDADAVELCISDYVSYYQSFYPIELSYIEFEDASKLEDTNGRKLRIKLTGNYEELNGFYLIGQNLSNTTNKAFYRSKLFKKENDEYIDVTPVEGYPTEATDYYIKDFNGNYIKTNLFNDGIYDDVDEESRPSSYADIENTCVLTFPNDHRPVKIHHTPNLFFYPPSYKSGLYLLQSKTTFQNKDIYDFDEVIMDKEFSVNGIYTLSGFTYRRNSNDYGIKDSYLEFTLWENKWFINGITF